MPTGPWLRREFAIALIFQQAMPAVACSLIDVEASTIRAVSTARAYLIVLLVLAAVILALDVYRRRPSVSLLVSTALVIVHPHWWMYPGYRPDCVFVNVEASQAVLGVVSILLAYRLYRLVRPSRHARTSSP